MRGGLLRAILVIGLLALAGCHTQSVRPEGSSAPKRGDSISEAAKIAFESLADTTANAGAGTGADTKPEDAYVHDWLATIQEVALDERKRAWPTLQDLIASAQFDHLTPRQQHAGLLLGGLVGLDQGEPSYARRLFVRSTAMPEAILGDWSGRYSAASASGDRVDALSTLATMLRRWPDEATDLRVDTLGRLLSIEPDEEEREPTFQALSALFDAGFKTRGAEPGAWWGTLAAELSRRGDLDRAVQVIARISLPRTLVALRADRRFDALTSRYPEGFDTEQATQRQVEAFERSVKNYPRSLGAVLDLEGAYFDAGRFADMLRTADGVIELVSTTGTLRGVYDGATTLKGIYRYRGLALEALHREDDAEAQYVRAADEDDDVGSILDLAEFYANRNRTAEAGRALHRLENADDKLSPYGRSETRLIRLTVAMSTGDRETLSNCLAYLRAHQFDSRQSMLEFQIALVRANLTEEATQLIRTRLTNPEQRREALIAIQTYAAPIDTPVVHETNARWEQILQRPEVQDTIKSFGHRYTYRLSPQT